MGSAIIKTVGVEVYLAISTINGWNFDANLAALKFMYSEHHILSVILTYFKICECSVYRVLKMCFWFEMCLLTIAPF